MSTTPRTKALHITTAAATGLTALSGYVGVVGLVGGGLTFGPEINARLPFDSLVLAGIALLCFVALPMTVAAIASFRATRHTSDLVFGAGLLLVAWIGVELAYIKVYSWFHPTYLAVAFVVLALGWLIGRVETPAMHHNAGTGERQLLA
jgi:hypothetical protein